ncbi:histidine phosphatase family protein [Azospirillum sp. 412522]|nr:histidine phosphatase family protein [Azospirillum sp. 412522]
MPDIFNGKSNPMRMVRLSIICSGITQAMRRHGFPADGSLESRSESLARKLAKDLAQADVAYAAPSIRARETAGLLGIEPSIRADLSDQDYGLWSGRSLEELEQTDPNGILAWMSDPGFAPPAGESVADVAGRAAGFLDEMRGTAGHVVAVTHGAVARGTVLHVLDAPLTAFWKIDTPPLCVTDLRFNGTRWVLRGHGEA